MDEKTFQDRYRKAYDKIAPRQECMAGIMQGNEEKPPRHRVFAAVGTGAAVLAALCLTVMLALPAAAKAAPGFYELVVKYAPSLADYCLPEEYSCTRQGITMQVEAVNVEGNSVQIVLSFSDAEGGGDLIHGPVELFGGYGMQSYGGESSIGGCSFLGYDEETDKAYLKMSLTSFQKIDKAKIILSVYRLLTDVTEEEQWISLDTMVKNPATKEEILSGRGGGSEGYDYFKEKNVFGRTEGTPEDARRLLTTRVMDIRKADAGLADELTIMGIGYLDGVLRVQVCRGTYEDADRHAQLFLVDSEGQERIEDLSVGWTEEIGGEKFSFDEHWFIVEEEELEDLRMYGIFSRKEGNVRGGWEVTLEIE